MRFDAALILLTLASHASASVLADAQPQIADIDVVARDSFESVASEEQELWKRKGGGGRGGRGSGGGGGGGGGGGRGGGPNPRGGAGGGRSVQGFGPQPSFGRGGRSYPGGAQVPYRTGPGTRSPIGGLLAIGLVGATAIAFWPGSWHYNRVHGYRYNNDYTFYNVTEDANQTKPVLCGCEENFPCGCDEDTDRAERDAVLDELIGNGSYAHLDKEYVDVGDYEGESTILLNGTLPFDTTLADPDAGNGGDGMRALLENIGWWPVAAAAMGAVFIA